MNRRERTTRKIAAGGILFLATSLAPAAADAKTLVLDRQPPRYRLGPYVELLRDQRGKWTITDVTGPRLSRRFVPVKTRVISRGLDSSVYWLRFTLVDRSAHPASTGHKWLLDIGRPFLLSARFYIPLSRAPPGGGPNRFRVVDAGDPRTLAPGRAQRRLLVFRLPDDLKHARTFFLRVKSDLALFLPLEILTDTAYLTKSKRRSLGFGLFLGIALGLGLFNLFLFLSLRDWSYLWYVLFVFFLTLFSLQLYGLIKEFVVSGRPEWIWRPFFACVALAILCSIQFTRTFMSSATNHPRLDKLLWVYGAFTLAALVLTAFAPPAVLKPSYMLLAVFGPMFHLVVGGACWRQGFRPARFFLLAWSFHAVGVWVSTLTGTGWLPYTTLGYYALPLGIATQMVLLSLALADRIKTLQQERETLQRGLERVGRIMDSVPVAILMIDPRRHRILEANQGAALILGLPREAVIGRDCRQTGCPGGPDICQAEGRSAGFAPVEHLLPTADNGPRPILRYAAPISLDGRRLILESLVDISERKAVEEERERLIDELQEALVTVKTLSGLLPICSNCKKIRNDEGYWEQVEAYIVKHSGAQFTHSICPECMAKLYPQRGGDDQKPD